VQCFTSIRGIRYSGGDFRFSLQKGEMILRSFAYLIPFSYFGIFSFSRRGSDMNFMLKSRANISITEIFKMFHLHCQLAKNLQSILFTFG
jgi:hypothetical protein